MIHRMNNLEMDEPWTEMREHSQVVHCGDNAENEKESSQSDQNE